EEGLELQGRQRGPHRQGGPAGVQAVRSRGSAQGRAPRLRPRLPRGHARAGVQTDRRGAETAMNALLILLALTAGEFRAGAAAVDVTPKQFPVNMPGLFNENLAEKAHDPMHARAIVLDDGSLTVALVLVDNLGVAREVCDEAKLLAARKLSILPENILI